MQRIDTVDNSFHEGNPAGGERGTKVTADFLNDVQEELCNVVEAAGITLADATRDQLLAAIQRLISSNGYYRVDDIAALRAIVGATYRPVAILEGYLDPGDGGGGDLFFWDAADTTADNGVTVIRPTAIDPGDPGRWTRPYDGWINFLSAGAVGDGATNDFTAFTGAAAVAGATGGLHLPARVFRFTGTRPRLQDHLVNLSAAPGASISVDVNPGVKLLQFLSPITMGSRRFHKNTDRDTTLAWSGAAAAEALRMSAWRASAGDFTTDWEAYHITGQWTTSAHSATITADTITWPTGAGGSGMEGIFRVPKGDIEHSEVTFQLTGQIHGGYHSIQVVGDAYRYSIRVVEAIGTVDVIRQDGVITQSTPLPNTLAYTLADYGSVTLSARVLDRRIVEAYINGLLVLRFDVTAQGGNTYIERYGYALSWHSAQYITITGPTWFTGALPQTSRPRQIAILGDSITYGAYASMDCGVHLQAILAQLPGFGGVTVRNRAVPGASTASWIAGDEYTGDGGSTVYSLATEDFSDDDFVIVMLGTNDCQSSIATSTFEANLATIAAAIVADGAVPIFGLPPVWQAGVGSWYTNISRYCASIRKFCAVNGYRTAETRGAFGANLAWYYDGIHPHEEGQVAIARSFAAALVAAAGPEQCADLDHTLVTTYYNNWVAYSNSDIEAAGYERVGGIVYLSGALAAGTVADSSSTAFFLPPECRPRKRRFFTVPSWNGTLYGPATIHIRPEGNVEVWSGYNTWVCLDGTSFPLR